jgi:hypothetical protein
VPYPQSARARLEEHGQHSSSPLYKSTHPPVMNFADPDHFFAPGDHEATAADAEPEEHGGEWAVPWATWDDGADAAAAAAAAAIGQQQQLQQQRAAPEAPLGAGVAVGLWAGGGGGGAAGPGGAAGRRHAFGAVPREAPLETTAQAAGAAARASLEAAAAGAGAPGQTVAGGRPRAAYGGPGKGMRQASAR